MKRKTVFDFLASPKALTVIALATWIPYLFASLYCFPVADDLSYSLQSSDIWQNYTQNYFNWCGRYTSNLLVLWGGLITPNLFLYQLYPVLLVITLCLGFSLFFGELKAYFGVKHPNTFLLASFGTGVFLNLLPSTAEGLYWLTGSITYVLPIPFVLLYLVLLSKYLRGVFIVNKVVDLVLIGVLLFLLLGFNETLMLLLLLLQLGIAISMFRYKRSTFVPIILLVIAIVGFSIDYFSPGSINRMSFFPQRHQLVRSVVMSIVQTARFSSNWFFSVPLISGAVLLGFVLVRGKVNTISLTVRHIKLGMTGLLLLVPLCAIFPPFWATGQLGQLRTLNACLIFFLIAFVLLTIGLSKGYCEGAILSLPKKVITALVVVFIISLFMTGNSHTILYDLLSGKATIYKVEMIKRDDVFSAAKENKDKKASVSLLSEKPKSLYVVDLYEDTSHWVNMSYAQYYGLETVEGHPK